MADFTDQFVVEEDVGADIRVSQPKASWADDDAGLHATFMKVAGSPSSRKGLPNKGDIEELDAHKLAQRQKQIDFGKNTIGYQRYVQLVPRAHRRRQDPATPDIHQRISKRCFDGQVKAWRRMLHAYDEPNCGPQRNSRQHSSRRQQQQEESEDMEQQQGASVASGSPAVSDRPSQTSLDGYMDPAVKVGTKRDRDHAFAANRDSGQQHNGSGASTATTADPAAAAAAAAAAVLCGDADAEDELVSREPDAKRSTASRSMDVSLPARDSSSNAANVGPTSFAGIGLASKLAGGTPAQPAAAAMPPPPPPAPPRAQGAAAEGAAAQPAQRKLRDPDNVVSLILGEDSRSCMSWQQQEDDELSNVGL